MSRHIHKLILATLLLATLPTHAVATSASFANSLTQVAIAPLALLTPDEVLRLMEGGELAQAEAEARAAVQARPDSARALVVLARTLARQGRLEEARAALAEAKDLPQWEEENIGVPYKSPRQIDQVMQRDPAAALPLIADVLLAECDDPKAYYLQALALVQLGDYAEAETSLNLAREYGGTLKFAHPDTLERLEALLRERPTSGGAIASPAINPPQPLPWWLWAGVGLGTGGLGWWGMGKWQRYNKRRKAELARVVADAHAELDAQIYAAQNGAKPLTPELERRIFRLKNLRRRLKSWESEPFQTGDSVRRHFGPLLAASQTDETWQAYQDELARQAAAAEQAERRSRKRRSKSSFSESGGNSWSSRSSGDSGGNNGGSKW